MECLHRLRLEKPCKRNYNRKRNRKVCWNKVGSSKTRLLISKDPCCITKNTWEKNQIKDLIYFNCFFKDDALTSWQHSSYVKQLRCYIYGTYNTDRGKPSKDKRRQYQYVYVYIHIEWGVIRYTRSWPPSETRIIKRKTRKEKLDLQKWNVCRSTAPFSACFWSGEISRLCDWALVQLWESAELRFPVDLVIWHVVLYCSGLVPPLEKSRWKGLFEESQDDVGQVVCYINDSTVCHLESLHGFWEFIPGRQISRVGEGTYSFHPWVYWPKNLHVGEEPSQGSHGTRGARGFNRTDPSRLIIHPRD
jgi:hypothetical protein